MLSAQASSLHPTPILPADPQLPLTLFFDGDCPLCAAEMRNLQVRDTYQRLRWVDIRQPGFVSPIEGVTIEQMLTLMHAQTADGRVLVGVAAFELAYQAVGMAWVARALQLPVVATLARALYPWVARHRMQIPSWVTRQVFERASRRWAEQQALRAVAQQCSEELCARP